MKQLLLIFALSLFCYLAAGVSDNADVTYEDEVAILTPIQFSLFKHRYPFLFVLFNYPTETDAQTTREFVIAAQKLQKQYPGIKFARIDAVNHTHLATQINMNETANIGLFMKASRYPIFYTESRDSKSFASWVLSFLKKGVKEVTDVETARNITLENEDTVFFLGSQNSGKFHEFLGAMSTFTTMFAHNLTFYQSDEEEVRNAFGIHHNKEAVVIFRNYSEERNVLEDSIRTSNIVDFITTYRYPTVMTYDKKARNRIQGGQEDGVILFKSNDEAGEKALKDFELIASKRRGQMVFIVIPAGENEHMWNYALGIFQITEEDFPKVGIIQSTGDMRKYLLDRELDEKGMEAFIVNYEGGNLTPFTRSQPIPTEDYDETDNMRVVVGRTFEEVVMDETKDVLIVFYSPECPYSKSFLSIFEIFAEKLRNVEGLVVAKINSDENELLQFDMIGVPSLKFYPKNNKKHPRNMGVPPVDQIIKVLRKYGTADMYEQLYEIETNRKEKQLLRQKEREARENRRLERAEQKRERERQKQINYEF